jgi:hypothetical protein
MEGFELAARFSLATNRRRFCGPDDAEAALYRAVTEGTGRAAAEAALARFEALYPYLAAIARKHGLEPFDREVVEAYWIGNRLLDGFTRAEFEGILAELVRRGLPQFLARELSTALPPEPVPHHVFHVAFVGVGNVTGHVETNLPNMEACRPGWAAVRAVGATTLDVEGPVLTATGGELALGGPRRRSVEFDRRANPAVAVGDEVALHWGWTALALDPEQRRALERYTRRSLKDANAARRSGTPPSSSGDRAGSPPPTDRGGSTERSGSGRGQDSRTRESSEREQ